MTKFNMSYALSKVSAYASMCIYGLYDVDSNGVLVKDTRSDIYHQICDLKKTTDDIQDKYERNINIPKTWRLKFQKFDTLMSALIIEKTSISPLVTTTQMFFKICENLNVASDMEPEWESPDAWKYVTG